MKILKSILKFWSYAINNHLTDVLWTIPEEVSTFLSKTTCLTHHLSKSVLLCSVWVLVFSPVYRHGWMKLSHVSST